MNVFFDYFREYNLAIKVARIFNTYGPRMQPNDGRVVSNFIIQALQNQDITIYGDGSQSRSFCYVDDLIDGLIQLMDTSDDFTGPVNLGNPNEFTIRELAEKVIKLTGSHAQFTFQSLPENDPVRRQPDIALAQENLHWQPTIQIDSGLEKTIDYFKDILKIMKVELNTDTLIKYQKKTMPEPV